VDVVVSELKKLKGKLVKIVYREHPNAEPYASVGIVKDANPSFVVVRGHDGLTHFIATDTIVRISERFSEKR